jgi:signal transduction histidine kinase
LDSPLDISIKNREEFYSDTSTPFLNKEGQGIPVNIISKPLYFNNTFAGFTLCLERRDLNLNALNQICRALQKETAEQSADAKLHFLSRITHEIRTPLNGIIGMTDLLLDSKLDDSQLEFAQVIKSSSTNRLTILNGVSDFFKSGIVQY